MTDIIAKNYLTDRVCFNCKWFVDFIVIPSGKKLKYKNPSCALNKEEIPKDQTCEFWDKAITSN